MDGSRPSAKAGNLVVMAAGDKNLYDRMEPIFGTIGKQSYFLGKNIIYRMYHVKHYTVGHIVMNLREH